MVWGVSPRVRVLFCQLTNSCGNTWQLCLEKFVVQLRAEEMRLSGSKATSHTGRAKCFHPTLLTPIACAPVPTPCLFYCDCLWSRVPNQSRADPTLQALPLPSPFFPIFEGMLLRETSLEPRAAKLGTRSS